MIWLDEVAQFRARRCCRVLKTVTRSDRERKHFVAPEAAASPTNPQKRSHCEKIQIAPTALWDRSSDGRSLGRNIAEQVWFLTCSTSQRAVRPDPECPHLGKQLKEPSNIHPRRGESKRGTPISGVRLIHEMGTCFTCDNQAGGAVAYLGVNREPRLAESQILNHFASHNF